MVTERTLDPAPSAAPDATLPIPRLIKRNTLLLALAIAFAGSGYHMVYSLGALMVVEILHSAALAGVGLAIVGVSRFVVAYPLGELTDSYGRKLGLLIGLGLAAIGGAIMVATMLLLSFPLFVIGMFILGMGIAASHQLRVAAADMYPPSRRAEGVGWVLTGSLIGAFGGPVLVALAQATSTTLQVPPLALSWVFVPVVVIPGIFLLRAVQPDPKEIAAHLSDYYPGYQPERLTAAQSRSSSQATFGSFLRGYPRRAALVVGFGAQGNMSMVMVAMSLVLADHGHHLAAISAGFALHTTGMFGFSVPIGRWCDRFGRRSVLAIGSLAAMLGSILVALTPDFWSITLGGFLVGLGWSGVNVASTALIADTTAPAERGRAVGTYDTITGIGAVLLALVTGVITQALGHGATAVMAVALMIPGFAMVASIRELTPGAYADDLMRK